KYSYGDHSSIGEYLNGMRHGNWKHYFGDGRLSFEGNFIEDNPNGRHTWYWSNGNKKTEGQYIMGIKHGEWIKFYPDGSQFISILYENGIETRFDGIRVRLMEEDEELLQTATGQPEN
ncbi:MAG: toxin-antitoxin system YwqK family antitoxin, partial [Bacteroidales bacterium]